MVEQFFKFVPLMRDSLYKTLSLACQQAEHAVNAAQAKDLLKIALQAVRLTRKIARPTDSVSSSWNTAAFEKIKEELANSDKFQASSAIQSLAKQMLTLLSQSSAAQKDQGPKKRKGNDEEPSGEVKVNGTQEAAEPRKKRKKVKKQKSE